MSTPARDGRVLLLGGLGISLFGAWTLATHALEALQAALALRVGVPGAGLALLQAVLPIVLFLVLGLCLLLTVWEHHRSELARLREWTAVLAVGTAWSWLAATLFYRSHGTGWAPAMGDEATALVALCAGGALAAGAWLQLRDASDTGLRRTLLAGLAASAAALWLCAADTGWSLRAVLPWWSLLALGLSGGAAVAISSNLPREGRMRLAVLALAAALWAPLLRLGVG